MSGTNCSNGDRQPTLPSPVSTGSAGGFQLGYRPAFDGIRGWGLVFVLTTHTCLAAAYLPRWAGSVLEFIGIRSPFLPRLLTSVLELLGIHGDDLLIRGGWIGVDAFFVLSGFLITLLLVKEWDRTGAINFKHFYLRRALRLLPAVVLMLVAVYLLCWLCLPRERMKLTRQGILSVLFYYANWRIIAQNAQPTDLLLHMWSLSLEEQFYLVWPIALWLMLWLRLRRGTIFLIIAGASVAAALARALTWAGRWHESCLPFMSLPTRLDTLLIGCLTGLLAGWNLLPRSRWGRRLLHGAACLSLLYLGWACIHLVHTADRYYYFDCTAAALLTAVLLASLVSDPPRFFSLFFEFPPAVWLGRISYGVYLWHFPLGLCLVAFVLARPALYPYCWVPPVVYAYVLAVGIAAVSFYVVEQPILRLKRHLEHRGGAPSASRKMAA